MRNAMIEACTGRVCAGGRHFAYKGKMPGVLEEIVICLEKKRSLFLLGGFGGVTASVCQLIQGQPVPEQLTEKWQVEHNKGYAELLGFSAARGLTIVHWWMS